MEDSWLYSDWVIPVGAMIGVYAIAAINTVWKHIEG